MNRHLQYQQLLKELTEYHTLGISLQLNGEYSTPEEIAMAHLVCETSSYMRDYIISPKGQVISELHFDQIKDD